MSQIDNIIDNAVNTLQDIIGTDAGNRGMKSLICPGDLLHACTTLASLPIHSHVVILSGFPCCVHESPPTETDGPPGAVALVRACLALGYKVTLVTDVCNEQVFAAALDSLLERVVFQVFPGIMSTEDDARLETLAKSANLFLACERAGPAQDGHCYTMRGIDMTQRGLIAPLHRMVELSSSAKLLAIGDGGNELGMGKVYNAIVSNPKIENGNKIGCVIEADYLIAASVSNWGGYALAAGAALIKAKLDEASDGKSLPQRVREWIEKCVPTEEEEVALLKRCVAKGCRDGVSGKVEATVDGMPLETSLQCLRDIREASLAVCTELAGSQ